jgi:hypothetical protein
MKIDNSTKPTVKKVHKEKTTTTIDATTGEILTTSTTQTFTGKTEPDFVKLYIDDVLRLKNLPQGRSTTLLHLLKYMGYNNVLPAYKSVKKVMCADLGISMNTLNKHIDDLYKAGILIRQDRGLYIVDPQLFGKGKWEDINNLRLSVEYTHDSKGNIKKTIKSDMTEQLKLM